MLKKWNNILNIVMGSLSGVFIGRVIFVCWDYKTHPGLYAMQSAPWYTGILVSGIYTLIALAITAAVKRIVQKQMRRKRSISRD